MDVETRCIVHRVNIHILICTLNVRETSDDWQTGICNISCTSRGFCRVSPWDLENCSVCLRCSGSMWCIARKTYMCCFHSNYEQWTKKINNSGITAPFNFVSQRSLCGNASDLSLSLFISSPSFSLWLQDTCHLMPFTKYSLLDQSYFFTSCLSIAHIKFTNKIHTNHDGVRAT